MKGFYMENIIDHEFYCDAINKLNYSEFVKPDPELKEILDNITIKKICFTNCETLHAHKILETLILSNCFDYVLFVDHQEYDFICKPMLESFHLLQKTFNVKDKILIFL